MQIRAGMGVRRYWYDLFSFLTKKKAGLINGEETLELDDISYECASENVNTNNMESRIHLEKATREGRILFTLERDLESKFVKLYILYSYLKCIFFLVLSSRCAIHLFTVVLKR